MFGNLPPGIVYTCPLNIGGNSTMIWSTVGIVLQSVRVLYTRPCIESTKLHTLITSLITMNIKQHQVVGSGMMDNDKVSSNYGS